MKPLCIALFLFSVAAGALAMSDKAAAAPTAYRLTVCNKSSVKIYVAAGYRTPGNDDVKDEDGVYESLSGPFVSEGWWNLDPGQCSQAMENPFYARFMYWFAHPEGAGMGDGFSTAANYHFCVPYRGENGQIPAFTYEDENASSTACQSPGNNMWVSVRRVDLPVNAEADYTGD
jgi:uncharacterized membrane protein